MRGFCMGTSASAAASRWSAGRMISRVESPGHGQGHGLHRAERLGHFRRPLAGPQAAGDDDVGRAKQVGDLEHLACRAFSHSASTSTRSNPRMLTMPLGVASAASCMAAPRRCTRIRPSAKSITPGENHGRVLTQAQPGGGLAGQHHVGRFGPQRFQRRQAGHKDRRLAVDGRIELFGRAPGNRAWPGRNRAPRQRGRTAGGRLGSDSASRLPIPTVCAPCPGNRKAILLKTRSRRLYGPCNDHNWDTPCASAGPYCTARNRKAAWASWHRVPGGCRCGRCFACAWERPLSNHLPRPVNSMETPNPKRLAENCQRRGGGQNREGQRHRTPRKNRFSAANGLSGRFPEDRMTYTCPENPSWPFRAA